MLQSTEHQNTHGIFKLGRVLDKYILSSVQSKPKNNNKN